MHVTKLQIENWHREGLALAMGYVRTEARMVELLSLICREHGYFYFQYESLSSYALLSWKLPENTARDMVTVARKSLEIPALLESLRSGRASVSKLRRICAVISDADQKEWIEIAERCSNREIERLIAAAKPEKAVHEGFFYRSAEVLEMRAALSEETRDRVLRVQDLLSQRENRSVALGEVIAEMASRTLEKLDPLKKADRVAEREIRGTCRVQGEVRRAPSRAALSRAIVLRDQAQCTYVNLNGERCPNRRWLHTHHIRPLSKGGEDTLENLTTLCSQHHRMLHFSEPGH